MNAKSSKTEENDRYHFCNTRTLPTSCDLSKKNLLSEWVMVTHLLVLAFLVRFYAALHTGIEVDEPIYRDAAAMVLAHIQALPDSLINNPMKQDTSTIALLYGYPSIRPAYLHPTIPFLYHPPFYLWLLAEWFKLWEAPATLLDASPVYSLHSFYFYHSIFSSKIFLTRKSLFLPSFLLDTIPGLFLPIRQFTWRTL